MRRFSGGEHRRPLQPLVRRPPGVDWLDDKLRGEAPSASSSCWAATTTRARTAEAANPATTRCRP